MESGSWSWQEAEGRIFFTLAHPEQGRGLCRAVALGREGFHRLGTLLPTQNGLELRRNIPCETLERAGCYPPEQVEFFFLPTALSARPPKGLEGTKQPAELLTDSLLQAHAQRLTLAFYRRSPNGELFLAVPYDGSGEFPMLPILCFATFEFLDQVPCICYHFDREGNPQLLNSF